MRDNTAAEVEQPNQRPKRDVGKARASEQPFEYPLEREYAEPDWRRLPGYADVSAEEWESAQWQRANTAVSGSCRIFLAEHHPGCLIWPMPLPACSWTETA